MRWTLASLVMLFSATLLGPGAIGADTHLVHMDWHEGSSLVGLHGVGHEAINEARFAFDVGRCHRDLRLDLLYAPSSAGSPDDDGPRVPYVFHAAILDAHGDVFSQRTITESSHGHRMGTVPAAGPHEVVVRMDIGVGVDWDVRVRGFAVDDEPTCALFLNEVETAPAGGLGQEWVELHNAGTTPLDVSGWQVWGTRGSEALDPRPIILPEDTSVPAGGHLRIFMHEGDLLADVNETVVLADPQGMPLDKSAPLTDTRADTGTWSRLSDGAGTWVFGAATPGAPNDP